MERPEQGVARCLHPPGAPRAAVAPPDARTRAPRAPRAPRANPLVFRPASFPRNVALAHGILMILGIMWSVPSKVRLDASTPRERPGRPSRRRTRVRAPPGTPCRSIGIPCREFLQKCCSSTRNIDDSGNYVDRPEQGAARCLHPPGAPRAAVAPPDARTRAPGHPVQIHWNSVPRVFAEMLL